MPKLRALAVACLAAALCGCASLEAAGLYRSGTEALDRGESERAVTDLERAARLAPDASEVHNHLGLAYAAAGRHAEAGLSFQRAVSLDCDNRAAAANLRAWQRRFADLGDER